MRDVFIIDTAMRTALGTSIDVMWPRLCQADTGIDDVDRFTTNRLDFHKAALIPDLNVNSDNPICSLICEVLDQLIYIPGNTTIIWTGSKGASPYIEQRQRTGSATSVYLPWHYRQMIAEHLGASRQGMEINAACASSTVGAALGAAQIATGRIDSAIVCAADIVNRFTFYGFSALKALTKDKCRPFDEQRDGLALGDGAVAVVLANEETMRGLGARPLARITGWGIANDANHITGPARDGCGLIAAIRSALRTAGASQASIQAFCAHGTGTVFNDGMELTALDSIFNDRQFPVFSIKGAIGHTLGASGGIEIAVCLEALVRKSVPATSGLQTPAPKARGLVSNEPQEFAGRNILTSNSGFGGINAALILEAA